MNSIGFTRMEALRGGVAMVLAVLVVLASAGVTPALGGEQPTVEELQKEIERLKIMIEVKQQRIEILERELEKLRAPIRAEEHRKIVLQVQREVERIRGLPAKEDVEMALLGADTTRELINRELKERYTDEEFRGWENSLKHLGLIPKKMDVEKFYTALFVEQAGGVYDDMTKKLYVSDRFDIEKTFTQMILSHEICHALQDQHFNLTSGPMRLKGNDDRVLACLSVIEGDAMFLMSNYFAENPSWNILLELPGLLMMDQSVANSAPNFMFQSLVFPYLQGMNFIMYDINPSGSVHYRARALNRLYENYPRSTEQVMHPEKYYNKRPDEPTEFDLNVLLEGDLIPAEDRFSNVAGEFTVKVLLTEQLTATEAERAASGWDGDRLVFGGDPDGDYAMAWLSVWDTERDAAEFAKALTACFKKQRPDLAGDDSDDEGKVRLSDDLGTVAVAGEGQTVICVHARKPERVEGLLKALAEIAADVKVVP